MARLFSGQVMDRVRQCVSKWGGTIAAIRAGDPFDRSRRPARAQLHDDGRPEHLEAMLAGRDCGRIAPLRARRPITRAL